MTLEMKQHCERCESPLPPDSRDARICRYECTFCSACSREMRNICPNCGGELVRRPVRQSRA